MLISKSISYLSIPLSLIPFLSPISLGQSRAPLSSYSFHFLKSISTSQSQKTLGFNSNLSKLNLLFNSQNSQTTCQDYDHRMAGTTKREGSRTKAEPYHWSVSFLWEIGKEGIGNKEIQKADFGGLGGDSDRRKLMIRKDTAGSDLA